MKKLYTILFFTILISSCSNCSKISNKKQNTNEKYSQLKKKERQQKHLAPGTTLIRATLLRKEDNVLTIKVRKILHYGHSTPRITQDSELKVSIENDKLKNELFENKTNKILLRTNSPKGKTSKLTKWEIINIEN